MVRASSTVHLQQQTKPQSYHRVIHPCSVSQWREKKGGYGREGGGRGEKGREKEEEEGMVEGRDKRERKREQEGRREERKEKEKREREGNQ